MTGPVFWMTPDFLTVHLFGQFDRPLSAVDPAKIGSCVGEIRVQFERGQKFLDRALMLGAGSIHAPSNQVRTRARRVESIGAIGVKKRVCDESRILRRIVLLKVRFT